MPITTDGEGALTAYVIFPHWAEAHEGWRKWPPHQSFGDIRLAVRLRQFSLVDRDDEAFEAPTGITPEMEERWLFVMLSGLTVYTQSCLQQHILVAIYDREPGHTSVEPMSDKPWTHEDMVEVLFP